MISLTDYMCEEKVAIGTSNKLDYKISFRSNFDDEGTHYSRVISIKCSQEQLDELNDMLWNTEILKNSNYKREEYELKFGDNFTKLTISKAFDSLSETKNKGEGKHNTLIKITKA